MLADAGEIVADDAAGRIQNDLRGAVIFFEADDTGSVKVAQKALKVAAFRAAPTVNGLIFVADDADVALVSGEQTDEFFLRGIGILKFVHLNVAQALRPIGANAGIFAEKPDAAKQQIVEIESRGFAQDGFVLAINGGGAFAKGVEGVGFELLGREIAIFGVADAFAQGAWSELFFGNGEMVKRELDDAGLIVVIVNGEVVREAGGGCFAAKEASAKGVERGNPNIGGVAAGGAQEVGDAPAHLLGGFVGEGYGENVSGGNALLDEVRDAIGDDARFSGAGAGEDQHGAIGGKDGFALLRIQVVCQGHGANKDAGTQSEF